MPTAGSFFLFGPRGTGKSTWVDATFAGALKIDLLKESTYAKLTSHPKFDFFDAGIYRAIRPRGPLDTDEEVSGADLPWPIHHDHR